MNMLGARSRSICVKFRMDDKDQMDAWDYLQNERGSKTYAEVITELIKNRSTGDGSNTASNCVQTVELLAEIRHICQKAWERLDGCAFSPALPGIEGADNGTEKMTHKGEIPGGVADLMRQLSGEDEDE